MTKLSIVVPVYNEEHNIKPFLNRTEKVSNYFLTYFNNDIQYGSKYILKRIIDWHNN